MRTSCCCTGILIPCRLKSCQILRLMSFENYGMKLEARFWIRDPMNGVNNVRSDVNRKIWQLFKAHGIKIPVQQQEVRVLSDRSGDADLDR